MRARLEFATDAALDYAEAMGGGEGGVDRHLSALLSVQEALLSPISSVESVMADICREAALLTAADGSVIELEEGDELVYRATWGTMQSFSGFRLKSATSLSGLAVATGEVVICDETENDPRVDRSACRLVGARSMVITPLVYRSRVVGVLKVMSGRPRAFARDAMDLLRLLAGFLAVAMVHAEAQDAREELRRREHERLAELERLRDELASLVVHDLRSPLSVVSSNLQYLREALPEGSRDALEAALEALAATKRLDALILLLLDVAKLEQRQLPVRKESVHPAVLVEELRALRAHQVRTRDVQIANAIDPGRCVNADAGLLRRMFDNIVDNALRHTPRGGRIEFVANGQGNLVELRIGNSGPPIPPEVRPRMFEKFIQGDHAARFNHGLGLYFCKLAVEAQGGRIWIESHADLPTVFAMSLPTP